MGKPRPLRKAARTCRPATRHACPRLLGGQPRRLTSTRLCGILSITTRDDRGAREGDVSLDVGSNGFTKTLAEAGGNEGTTVLADQDIHQSSWNVDPSASSASVDGYTLVNARVGYRFAGRVWSGEILLSAKNLSDTMWIAFTEPDPDGNSYQPGPGREYFGGVMLRF